MKKISLVILMLMVAVMLFAEGLNYHAQLLKDETPDIYAAIKNRAIKEWENDNVMILFTINNQADAMYESIALAEDHDFIVKTQIIEWCDDDPFRYETALLAPVDWVMVLYTSRAQIKAQSQY